MAETVLLPIVFSVTAACFGLLVAVLGWIGNKIYTKTESIESIMQMIANDLHEKINNLDRRVTRVETSCELRRKDDPQ